MPLFNRLKHLFTKEIWRPEYLRDYSIKGLFFALLRIFSITWTVFNETKAASRAASLSYSSLLGLGPLLALSMLVAGFMLDSKNPDMVVDSLNRMIKFVAPQVTLTETIAKEEHNKKIKETTEHAPPSAPTPEESTSLVQPTSQTEAAKVVEVNSELVSLINEVIAGTRSGTAGALGVFSLLFIVLMLFTSVENAFNEIWGVRRGRSWVLRIVFYWTIVTLGALFFFASLTGLGASAYISVFIEKVPYGNSIAMAMRWILPMASVICLVGMLSLFYRFVPNTHVFWRAALAGAVVVTALIFINNMLAFTYFRRVLQMRSLYGSVALIPVLMLGLYIFWLFVLVGGQVSYAVQNVHFRNSQAAWTQLAESMRERLSLAVLITVCRRFQECLDPLTASELGDLVRVPTQIVNESINRLIDMGLITPVPSADENEDGNNRFIPAKPVSKITLQLFKQLDDNHGDDPAGETLTRVDPLIGRYDSALADSLQNDFFTCPLDQLIAAASPAENSGGGANARKKKGA